MSAPDARADRVVLAVDLGSASGRIIAGTLRDGVVEEAEVRRFPHQARLVDGIFFVIVGVCSFLVPVLFHQPLHD